MWIRGIHSGLVAQVTNPDGVVDDYREWEYGGDCWYPIRETVNVFYGFKFPSEWKGDPGTDCFVRIKGKKFWKGLKVRWDDSIGCFKTV